jgi:hypothetical protein
MRLPIAPFALVLAFAAATLPPSAVLAQNAAADPITEVARQRFTDGVTAYDAGRFEEARLAFQQAYTLTQKPILLLNIGLSEVKGGKLIEGGNHLLQFLREVKDAKPEQRKSANDALATVGAKANSLTITVDVSGAEVSVDGAKVGVSPLPGPLFVEPGSRTIMASLNGKSAFTKVDAPRGKSASANVVLGQSAPPAVVAPIAAVPPAAATAAPTAPPPPSPYPASSASLAPPPVPPTAPFAPPTTAPAPTEPSGQPTLLQWYLDRPLAWVGTGLTAVGLGVGIGFSAAASASSSDVDEVARQIRDKAAADGVTSAPCGPLDGSGAGDVYPSACGVLRNAISVNDANTAVAVTGWVVGGLALAGTVTYAVFDWYLPKKSAADSGALQLGVFPILAPGVRGAGVVGQF